MLPIIVPQSSQRDRRILNSNSKGVDCWGRCFLMVYFRTIPTQIILGRTILRATSQLQRHKYLIISTTILYEGVQMVVDMSSAGLIGWTSTEGGSCIYNSKSWQAWRLKLKRRDIHPKNSKYTKASEGETSKYAIGQIHHSFEWPNQDPLKSVLCC